MRPISKSDNGFAPIDWRAAVSQMELGRQIGVTFQQVQKYEKGANRIGAGRIAQIARVLKVPVSAFFGAAKSDPTVAPDAGRLESDYLAAPGASRLVRAYARIPHSVLRRAVLALLERLVTQDKAQVDRRA